MDSIDNNDKKAMQEVIPVCKIDKVNVHYKDPNKDKATPKQVEGSNISDLDPREMENWR